MRSHSNHSELGQRKKKLNEKHRKKSKPNVSEYKFCFNDIFYQVDVSNKCVAATVMTQPTSH